uniref:Ints3-like C-terminal domain-containing protein n=1 Tax=Ciona savignyi TaxID=51511 RepID=H2ZMS9_CIOSA
MLAHVDNLRKSGLPKSCNLFTQDSIIACLVHVQEHCDDKSKSKYSDLFALADDSEDEVLMRDIRNTRKRNKSTSASRSASQSRKASSQGNKRGSEESESDSLSDDDDFKKKRKRSKPASKSQESSDSD